VAVVPQCGDATLDAAEEGFQFLIGHQAGRAEQGGRGMNYEYVSSVIYLGNMCEGSRWGNICRM